MLVEKAQGGSPGVSPGADRLADTTKTVVRAFTPRNLDKELPGARVAHGFNIGLTPVLFAAIGYGVDRLAGTLPVFTIAFAVLSMVGLMARFYYSYKATVAAEEEAWRARKAKGRGSRR